MAEQHEAFKAHSHVQTVWVNEATGAWYIHPQKGCTAITREEVVEEPKEKAPAKEKAPGKKK